MVQRLNAVRTKPDDSLRSESLEYGRRCRSALLQLRQKRTCLRRACSSEFDPKRAWAFNDRGFAYYLKGDPDSAFADFEQVIFVWVFPYSDLSRGLKIPCFPDGFRDTAGCCSAR